MWRTDSPFHPIKDGKIVSAIRKLNSYALTITNILLVWFGGEGYNWNQLILHASIYLRKQSLEILIC